MTRLFGRHSIQGGVIGTVQHNHVVHGSMYVHVPKVGTVQHTIQEGMGQTVHGTVR